MTKAGLLKGTVKHYDWGGTLFIPSLINVENTEGKPFAEYWLGAHALADCKIEWPGNGADSLNDVLRKDPENLLGKDVYQRFQNLPYLLKTLDVKQMLSIQVHPSKKAAEIGFEEENKAGIPIDSSKRNYKDNNHKPELMLALGEFWLLHGFKPAEEIRRVLNEVEELLSIASAFQGNDYANLYRHVMEMPQPEVNRILKPLLDRILPLYKAGKLDKSLEDFWAARAAITFQQEENIDRGIFSIYLFNLLKLEKGQAIFQDAGIPHAYLEGQNVEIMANSDNVLRGGLTTKLVDVKELLKHVKPEVTEYKILNGEKKGDEIIYKTKAPDFELSCFPLQKDQQVKFRSHTLEILLVTGGEVAVKAGSAQLELKKGSPAAILFAGEKVTMHAVEETTVYRATVPVHSGE